MISPNQAAAEAYEEWEKLGRGWQLNDEWVVPEPLFESFSKFLNPKLERFDDPKDDGHVPSLLGRLTNVFKKRSQSTAPEDEELDYFVQLTDLRVELVEYKVGFPTPENFPESLIEHFLLSISMAEFAIGFEVIGDVDSITVILVVAEEDAQSFADQFASHFPTLQLSETQSTLENAWHDRDLGHHYIADLGLAEDTPYPIIGKSRQRADPFLGFVGALRSLRDGEIGFFQILFQPAVNRWGKEFQILLAATDGGPSYADGGPNLASIGAEKLSAPLYGVTARIGTFARTRQAAKQRTQNLFSSLVAISQGAQNSLIPLQEEADEPDIQLLEAVLHRTRRSGMLLNIHELASMFRFPTTAVVDPKLRGVGGRTRSTPQSAATGSLYLGSNTHLDETIRVHQTAEERTRHTYIVGASGTGKSNLLLHMLIQDVNSDDGICVLDPHGDLIDELLPHIPRSRHKDVILFDPSDEEAPVGLNILKAHTEREKHLLSSDLVAVFEGLSTSWGDQMTAVLHNSILAFLEHPRGGTIADLRRFLVEKDFRRDFVKDVQDEEVRYFFQHEFPTIRGNPQTSVLTRLGKFLRSKLVRNVVSQRDAKLDVASAMDGGKIILARLSEGAIGEENAYLLAAVLISKIYQSALARQEQDASSRKDFWLYIDEFHHFITPSMAAILSGARKYRLGLVLAHQELGQLNSRDKDVASAVLSNPYTRISFRVGGKDAKQLAEGFDHFEANDITNLATGQALCRLEQSSQDFNLAVPLAPSFPESDANEARERIRRLSRMQWGQSPSVEPEKKELSTPGTPKEKEAPPKDRPKKPTESAEVPEADAVVPKPELPSTPAPKERPSAPAAKPPLAPAPSPPPATDSTPPATTPTESELSEATEEFAKRHGRGGDEHTYLQEFVKKVAESYGYRCVIEEQMNDRKGWVDISLSKGGEKIAVEVCHSTSASHEVANLKNRIEAGYSLGVSLAADEVSRAALEKHAIRLVPSGLLESLRFTTIEEFANILRERDNENSSSERKIKGWKVKTTLSGLSETEREDRKSKIVKLTADAVRRISKLAND